MAKRSNIVGAAPSDSLSKWCFSPLTLVLNRSRLWINDLMEKCESVLLCFRKPLSATSQIDQLAHWRRKASADWVQRGKYQNVDVLCAARYPRQMAYKQSPSPNLCATGQSQASHCFIQPVICECSKRDGFQHHFGLSGAKQPGWERARSRWRQSNSFIAVSRISDYNWWSHSSGRMALNELFRDVLNKAFLSYQQCIMEAVKGGGDNNYKVPNMSKNRPQCEGELLVHLSFNSCFVQDQNLLKNPYIAHITY